MATINKDAKTGTYYFVLDAGKDLLTGKRKQLRRRGFGTKKDAQIALAKLQLQLVQKKLISIPKQKFSVYLSQWFESKKIKLKPSTQKNYDEQIKHNILPYLGEMRLMDLNESVLQSFINTLYDDRGLAPATIRATFGIVSEVVGKAAKSGFLCESIIQDVSLPRCEKKLRVWTLEQITTFLDSPSKILNLTRHFIGFNISIQTGMRMGEVLGLRWSDIDFQNQLIKVRQTLGKVDQGEKYGLVDGGKTLSSKRTIYISISLIKSLEQHKMLVEKERAIQGSGYIDLDLVVCTKQGNWVHPNNFRRAFKVTSDQLDIPEIRLHDLRHTHATFLLENKMNPKIIQERLGHKNVSVTLNTYSHVLPSMQLEAAGKFDSLFKL